MDDELDKFAQRAGEEFVAAGRAGTAKERQERRAAAFDYQQRMGKLRRTGRENS